VRRRHHVRVPTFFGRWSNLVVDESGWRYRVLGLGSRGFGSRVQLRVLNIGQDAADSEPTCNFKWQLPFETMVLHQAYKHAP
jgi:hypothetical protein